MSCLTSFPAIQLNASDSRRIANRSSQDCGHGTLFPIISQNLLQADTSEPLLDFDSAAPTPSDELSISNSSACRPSRACLQPCHHTSGPVVAASPSTPSIRLKSTPKSRHPRPLRLSGFTYCLLSTHPSSPFPINSVQGVHSGLRLYAHTAAEPPWRISFTHQVPEDICLVLTLKPFHWILARQQYSSLAF